LVDLKNGYLILDTAKPLNQHNEKGVSDCGDMDIELRNCKYIKKIKVKKPT
jgi:hypothetical protein